MNLPEEIAGQVATAVRTIATTASARLGADCIWHALACQHLLAREGIDDARLVAGYAAWRVDGRDPGAVVCHHSEGPTVPDGTSGYLFHAWVACGRQVFDATTYQFRRKLAELDAADGGRTTVLVSAVPLGGPQGLPTLAVGARRRAPRAVLLRQQPGPHRADRVSSRHPIGRVRHHPVGAGARSPQARRLTRGDGSVRRRRDRVTATPSDQPSGEASSLIRGVSPRIANRRTSK